MCKWGTSVVLSVPIPASLSHTGEKRIAEKGIDACIAPIVKALNDAGIETECSCCGHGKSLGRIDLADGRILYVWDPSRTDEIDELKAKIAALEVMKGVVGDSTLADAERAMICRALYQCDGNRNRAAKQIGMGERTLYRKMKEYGIVTTAPQRRGPCDPAAPAPNEGMGER